MKDTKGIGKGDITSNNINYRRLYNTLALPIIYTLADHLPSAPSTCYLLPLCLEADIQYMVHLRSWSFSRHKLPQFSINSSHNEKGKRVSDFGSEEMDAATATWLRICIPTSN